MCERVGACASGWAREPASGRVSERVEQAYPCQDDDDDDDNDDDDDDE